MLLNYPVWRNRPDIKGRPDMPGHIYFSRPKGHTGVIPEEQERARLEIEKFVSVLRIVFQEAHTIQFGEFYNRILTIAQAVFDPTGFNPHPLNDLPEFKNEIVQIAAATIKAEYTKKLLKSVLIGSFFVVSLCLLLQWIIGPNNPEGMGESGNVNAVTGYLRWDGDFSIVHTALLLAASFFGLLFASVTRTIEPSFETLQTPNADLIEPWVRLLFYGIAVTVLAILFQVQLVTITIGEEFSTANIGSDALTAILVGVLLGVAERALPRELELWSKKLLPSSQ